MERAGSERPERRQEKIKTTDLSVMAKYKAQRLTFITGDSNNLKALVFTASSRARCEEGEPG